MIVCFLDYGSGLRAGLGMASTVRANDRINLYPATPIRLATMLRPWTITGQGWDYSLGRHFRSPPRTRMCQPCRALEKAVGYGDRRSRAAFQKILGLINDLRRRPVPA